MKDGNTTITMKGKAQTQHSNKRSEFIEPLEANMATTDKNGREIMAGDTLKMFHFTGPRLKKYYMYKFVKKVVHGKYMELSHLDLAGKTFRIYDDGKQHHDIEIVQGYGSDGTHFEDRPSL